MKTYNYLKQSVGGYIEVKFPKIFGLLDKHKTGVKYMFSGGTAATVNIVFLYLFTDIFGLWYLASSVVAFIFSFLTSFYLQKFWTFRDNSFNKIKTQLALYISVGAVNFFIGPILLFLFVEFLHVWYLFGQILSMGVLAMANYLFNKFVTFKKKPFHESVNV